MMKKKYKRPTITEVHLDGVVTMIGGCKKQNIDPGKTSHTCNFGSCKTSGATS